MITRTDPVVIAYGSLFTFIVLVVMLALFLVKIRIEEQYLLEEFGEGYKRYCHDLRALVPYLL